MSTRFDQDAIDQAQTRLRATSIIDTHGGPVQAVRQGVPSKTIIDAGFDTDYIESLETVKEFIDDKGRIDTVKAIQEGIGLDVLKSAGLTSGTVDISASVDQLTREREGFLALAREAVVRGDDTSDLQETIKTLEDRIISLQGGTLSPEGEFIEFASERGLFSGVLSPDTIEGIAARVRALENIEPFTVGEGSVAIKALQGGVTPEELSLVMDPEAIRTLTTLKEFWTPQGSIDPIKVVASGNDPNLLSSILDREKIEALVTLRNSDSLTDEGSINLETADRDSLVTLGISPEILLKFDALKLIDGDLRSFLLEEGDRQTALDAGYQTEYVEAILTLQSLDAFSSEGSVELNKLATIEGGRQILVDLKADQSSLDKLDAIQEINRFQTITEYLKETGNTERAVLAGYSSEFSNATVDLKDFISPEGVIDVFGAVKADASFNQLRSLNISADIIREANEVVSARNTIGFDDSFDASKYIGLGGSILELQKAKVVSSEDIQALQVLNSRGLISEEGQITLSTTPSEEVLNAFRELDISEDAIQSGLLLSPRIAAVRELEALRRNDGQLDIARNIILGNISLQTLEAAEYDPEHVSAIVALRNYWKSDGSIDYEGAAGDRNIPDEVFKTLGLISLTDQQSSEAPSFVQQILDKIGVEDDESYNITLALSENRVTSMELLEAGFDETEVLESVRLAEVVNAYTDSEGNFHLRSAVEGGVPTEQLEQLGFNSEDIQFSAPTSLWSTLANVAMDIIPVVGTVRYAIRSGQDGFSREELAWLSGSAALDALIVFPFLGAAARSSRGATATVQNLTPSTRAAIAARNVGTLGTGFTKSIVQLPFTALKATVATPITVATKSVSRTVRVAQRIAAEQAAIREVKIFEGPSSEYFTLNTLFRAVNRTNALPDAVIISIARSGPKAARVLLKKGTTPVTELFSDLRGTFRSAKELIEGIEVSSPRAVRYFSKPSTVTKVQQDLMIEASDKAVIDFTRSVGRTAVKGLESAARGSFSVIINGPKGAVRVIAEGLEGLYRTASGTIREGFRVRLQDVVTGGVSDLVFPIRHPIITAKELYALGTGRVALSPSDINRYGINRGIDYFGGEIGPIRPDFPEGPFPGDSGYSGRTSRTLSEVAGDVITKNFPRSRVSIDPFSLPELPPINVVEAPQIVLSSPLGLASATRVIDRPETLPHTFVPSIFVPSIRPDAPIDIPPTERDSSGSPLLSPSLPVISPETPEEVRTRTIQPEPRTLEPERTRPLIPFISPFIISPTIPTVAPREFTTPIPLTPLRDKAIPNEVLSPIVSPIEVSTVTPLEAPSTFEETSTVTTTPEVITSFPTFPEIEVGDDFEVDTETETEVKEERESLLKPLFPKSPFGRFEFNTNLSSDIDTRLQTETKAEIAQKQKVKIATEEEPRPKTSGRLPFEDDPEIRRVSTRARVKGVSFLQEEIWITIWPPFREDNIAFTLTAPQGTIIVKDARAAFLYVRNSEFGVDEETLDEWSTWLSRSNEVQF